MSASYLNLVQYIKQKKWILCLDICLYYTSLVWGGFFLYQCIIIPRFSLSIPLLFRQGLMSQRVWSHSCSMLNFRPSCYSTSWGVHQQTRSSPKNGKATVSQCLLFCFRHGKKIIFFSPMNKASLSGKHTVKGVKIGHSHAPNSHSSLDQLSVLCPLWPQGNFRVLDFRL